MSAKIEDLAKKLSAANSMWDLESVSLSDIKSAVADLVSRLHALEKTVKVLSTPAAPVPPKAAPDA